MLAVVGERGIGKSVFLERLVDKGDWQKVLRLSCRQGGFESLREDLAIALDLDADADTGEVTAALAACRDTLVCIDEAHRLVRPAIGGLSGLDLLFDIARSDQPFRPAWIVSMNLWAWQYVSRARGGRPLFDDIASIGPWHEESLMALLAERNRVAGISPRFDNLGTDSPGVDGPVGAATATEIERSYYRMLWDYADGNPSVALHFWRESLGIASDGTVVVRLAETPDPGELDGLPLDVLLALRVMVQMEICGSDDIVDTTALSAREVADAVRYLDGRGLIEVAEGRWRVTMRWYRAVTRALERRHLLVR